MLDKLQPNPKNPRLIKKDEFERLKKKIKEFPEMLEKRPIVYDENFIVLGGNQRLRALQELAKEGFEIKDSYFQSAEGWTEEQKRKFVILDNISDGEWDYSDLANEWSDLPLAEWGLDPTNWETDEVVEDEAPEVSDEPVISKLGEVYQLGRHRLMCGDSTKIEDVEKLMDGKKADMVFTDPPYGMNLDTDYTDLAWGDRKGKKYDKVIGDNEDFKPELITTIFDNFGYCKEMFIWGADYFYKHIPNFDKGHYLVWDKTLTSNGDADSNSEYELLWTKEKHKRQVLHFNWFRYFGLSKQDGGKRIHPTQKPLQVLTPIIKEYSKQDDMVLDLFGGSGSTLIACEQTNRTCYMMELDPKYCDVIRKRYAKLIDKEDQWQTITPKI